MCYVWTSAERVKEQEKQMPLEKYVEHGRVGKQGTIHYCLRRPLAARLVNYALCAYLFSSAVFGSVVGALWLLGFLEMWLA